MKSNFSDLEYLKLQVHRKDKDKMARFYRFWVKKFAIDKRTLYFFVYFSLKCLKESYLKAVGVGITQNLRNISFSVGKFSDLTEENRISTTMLDIDGNAADEWQFEESFLCPDHFVTVCTRVRYLRHAIPRSLGMMPTFFFYRGIGQTSAEKIRSNLLI